MVEEITRDFLMLFATIDPIGTLSIFVALTGGMAAAERRRVAVRATLLAGGVLIADHSPGLYDEHLKRRPVGLLDELFGVRERSFTLRDLLVREGRPADAARLPTGAAAAEVGVRGALAEPAGDLKVESMALENRASDELLALTKKLYEAQVAEARDPVLRRAAYRASPRAVNQRSHRS